MGKSVVMSVQHATRLIPITLSWSGGTPSIGEGDNHVTVADTNPGIATITFNNAFARKPIITYGVEAATGEKVTVTLRSVAADSVIVEAINEAGTAADLATDVHLLVFGFDSADEG
jgi:hypothetical protein